MVALAAGPRATGSSYRRTRGGGWLLPPRRTHGYSLGEEARVRELSSQNPMNCHATTVAHPWSLVPHGTTAGAWFHDKCRAARPPCEQRSGRGDSLPPAQCGASLPVWNG